MGPLEEMNNLLRNLLMAQRCAHVHHWQTTSFAKHLALGELYELLTKYADDFAEMYMGAESGNVVSPDQSDPNHFSQQDPVEFVRQLMDVLTSLKSAVVNYGFLLNKYEEMQGEIARIKYKLERLA